MSEELLVNVTPQETRVAVVENGSLQELHIERSRSRGIVANIYKGKVVRVLPGMQAAFVDIGIERTAFLHASDFISHRPDATGLSDEAERIEVTASEAKVLKPDIADLVHEGQEIVVQIAKDPIGSKGARLTTQLSIPSRYLVLLPGSTHRGISQRIQDLDQRVRLLEALDAAIDQQSMAAGFIVRTVAEFQEEIQFGKDIEFLNRSWRQIEQKMAGAKGTQLIHADLPLSLRVIRDLARDDVEKIRVDSHETYALMRQFADDLMPEMSSRIEVYPGERPIFDLYSVEDEIQKALDRTVNLKSGGSLVFDQTEAMTTVDVNSGSAEGDALAVNLEAAAALAQQIRLRALGGLIAIDFIDMTDEAAHEAVLKALDMGFEGDKNPVRIGPMSEFSVVEMTRRREVMTLAEALRQNGGG